MISAMIRIVMRFWSLVNIFCTVVVRRTALTDFDFEVKNFENFDFEFDVENGCEHVVSTSVFGECERKRNTPPPKLETKHRGKIIGSKKKRRIPAVSGLTWQKKTQRSSENSKVAYFLSQ